MGAEAEQGTVLQASAGGELPLQEGTVEVAGAAPAGSKERAASRKARVAGW
ncbi:hypothetical protein STENM36S_09038 [Streptomyces tendae]